MYRLVTKRESQKKSADAEIRKKDDQRFAVRFKDKGEYLGLAHVVESHGGPQHVLERLIPWWAGLDDITRAMLVGAIKPRDDLLRVILDRENRRRVGTGLDDPGLPTGSKPRDGGPAGDKPRGDAKK